MYNKIAANVYKLESNIETLESTVECDFVDGFENFLYDSKPFYSETSVVVGAPNLRIGGRSMVLAQTA